MESIEDIKEEYEDINTLEKLLAAT